MNPTVTIVPLDETNPTALYLRHDYHRVDGPQPCYVELDLRDGELTADTDPNLDGSGLPGLVWHGVRLRWTMPLISTADVNTLLRDITPLAQRVLDDTTITTAHTGDPQVSRTEDSYAAEEEIIDLLRDPQNVTPIYETDAGEWWGAGDLPEDLTAATTDAEITAIAAREEHDALTMFTDAYTMLVGAAGYLTARREEMRDEVRDELVTTTEQHAAAEAHRAELERRRNTLILTLLSLGDSHRSVATLAGLSHPAVLKIVKKTSATE